MVAAADDSPGSLRQAIFDANAAPGADTIVFADGISGTILLSEGQLAITESLTITGPGAAQLTLEAFDPTPDDDNGDGNRIFMIDDDSTGIRLNVTFSGLTLTGGDVNNGGGAIVSLENLTIVRSHITGNTVSSTTGFLTAGGGIYSNNGNLTIDDSTISNNYVYHDELAIGGGIAAGKGNVTIRNSTISGNRARIRFGVSGGTGYGGGIALGGGTHLIANSTFSDNRVSGMDSFGGGIFINGDPHTTVLDHTIVANNGGNLGPDISSTSAVTTRFSLVENIAGWVVNDEGSNIFNQDPKLGDDLIDYGGPTPTLTLLPGSPAIDQGQTGTNGLPTFDQRGAPFDRVADGNGDASAIIDIGAYEVQTVPGLNLVVDTLADEVDGDLSAGDLSLREAIGLANGSFGPDTITFAAGLSSQTIVLTKGDLRIADDLTIDGTTGTGVVIIDASGNDPTPGTNQGDGSRIFWIEADDRFPGSIDVALSGLHLTGGDVLGDGGAITSRANLQLTNMTINQNYATGYGGGLDQGGGSVTLTIESSTISGNGAAGGTGAFAPVGYSTRGGGGIRVVASDTDIVNSTISGNRTTGNESHGGGIAAIANEFTVRHSTITGNSTSGTGSRGGNIFSYVNEITLDHTIVANGISPTDNDIYSPFIPIMANNSLIEDATGLTIVGSGNSTGADPLLGPLIDNGGPTRTHALLAGSPAIDGGKFTFAGPPDVDQRGGQFVRVANGDGDAFTIVDIGAYERQTIAGLSLVVDTMADEYDGIYTTGDLSLREAIGLANGSTGSDTITFAAELIGKTIVLELGELRIVDDVVIDATGLGGSLTIDADGDFSDPTTTGNGNRVFTVDDGDDGNFLNVEMRGLTLTGGDIRDFQGGGAILNAENLTIVQSTISGNKVAGSRFGIPGNYTTSGGRGGGIHVRAGGSLTLIDSTVNSNGAAYGGGLSIDLGQLTITSSTISSNVATEDGGGIWATGMSTTVIANYSTIAGNTAAQDGGGVLANNAGSITLNHTIVADNFLSFPSTGIGPDVFSADPVTFDHGWVENPNGFTPTGGLQFIGVDPLLAPLADNGGPTRTHALLAGSPAIDAGNLFFIPPPATDQRGGPFDRVFDGNGDSTPRIDIGAYERQTVAGLNLVVDTTTDQTNGNFNPGDLSLREAVKLANGSIGADTISFAAGLSGAAIMLLQGQIDIIEDLTVDGLSLSQNVIVDASGNDPTPDIINGDGSRLFLVSDNFSADAIDVSLRGLELTGGDIAGNGGAIFSMGNLQIEESTIRDNGAVLLQGDTILGSGAGGGIYAVGGSLVITNTTISGNSALGDGGGGGMVLFFVNATLTNSTVSGNMTADYGGGIRLSNNSRLSIMHSTISDNIAPQDKSGGGISVEGNIDLTVNHTIVANNQAGTGPDIASTDLFSLTFSLIEVASGFTSTGSPNITGQDPLLGPLSDNGGPTQTHALLAGSPAIDMGQFGVTGAPAFDQRGTPFDRIVAGIGAFEVIDIGAFEAQPIDTTAPLVTVDTLLTSDTTPELTGTVDDPAATITVDVGGQVDLVATNNGNGTWRRYHRVACGRHVRRGGDRHRYGSQCWHRRNGRRIDHRPSCRLCRFRRGFRHRWL